jgi:hypothetical protein
MKIHVFLVKIMFKNHVSIEEFIIRKVQHVVACIIVVVVQMHGHVN